MPKFSNYFLLVTFYSCCLFASPLMSNAAVVESFKINFFADQIPIQYAPDMKIKVVATKLDERIVDQNYHNLKGKNTAVLLNSLLQAKEKFQLNDFLFSELARRSIAIIYQGKSAIAAEITLFHILAQAGFDTRLTYRANEAFVNVYTQEEVFEIPIISDNGRSYANISCRNGACNGRQRLFIFRLRPNPTGRSFGFQLPFWPKLSAQPVVKPVSFNFKGQIQRMDITFDKTMVDIMREYPFINEYAYLETPLSPTLSQSLLPQLSQQIEGLDKREKLEFLVSFTRSAFEYKEDNEYFGRSKPMVPEELFSYAYSDCEDRSALFFALAKDLLNVSMLVIAYEDHLSIAVESADIQGDYFNFEGRRYIFCDPTGPKGSSQVGQIPPGYEDKSFEIIGQYK